MAPAPAEREHPQGVAAGGAARFRLRERRERRGFEKVLIGTRGARETLLQGRKVRAAKNSVLTSGVKQLKC